MFDASTVDLMRAAPNLEGLDTDSLPKTLTSAYATIVAARLRLRELNPENDHPALSQQVVGTIKQMRRLAYAQEALISIAPDREDRMAGAFVAGAAHHVVLQAERLLAPDVPPSRLDINGVSPEISATLLFLVAEACADASEMAKAILIDDNARPLERILLRSIQQLADGALTKILEEPDPVAEAILIGPPGQRATETLYLMLLRGIRALAARLLNRDGDDPLALFSHVGSLSTHRLTQVELGGGGAAYSVYPGPSHLAALLSAVARDLPSAALANLPAPVGLDGGRWAGMVMEIASKRPYLWRNHRDAVERGYLETGVSSVVSFPTGAGKSTLSELKIAATLLRGLKVVFLAPTLALVDQTARALRSTFPAADLQRERDEASIFDFDADALPTISVMTPERCLALMGFEPTAFAGVGLLVFDECHLLHPRDLDRSRRSLDAMLCVLNFTVLAPEADLLLLSAMMSNADALAEWIGSLTDRRCLALNLNWKPTRQVRGCVVYGAGEVTALRQRLAHVRATVRSPNAPAATKRQMRAQPYGFFCLNQTWQSKRRDDYSLLPLLDDPVTLAVATSPAGGWYLTPNGLQVASALAVGAAATTVAGRGLKTLVFTQTIPHAQSSAKLISDTLGDPGCVLTEEEKRLYDISRDEMGGEAHLYISVADDGRLTSSCAPHHGLLLPSERQLHEALFKRPDGIQVLVATSTLAQGMNLPSHVVIIAGDSRFDPTANQMERLEAHELLNAAGRAGRAGENAYGFVLVVPSKVVHFDDATSTIHHHWTELQAIFSQSDQCLAIEDPLQPVLDRIHELGALAGDSASYLLRRLPVGAANDDDPDGPARSLLNRSMYAYFRRKAGDQAWVDSRIDAALVARHADQVAPAELDWADRLAAAAGVESAVIRGLAERMRAQEPALSVNGWRAWVFDWLAAQPNLVPELIRRESLENLLGRDYRVLENDTERGLYAIPVLTSLLADWMEGKPLVELERTFGTQENRFGRCGNAREFVLRLVPELAYIFTLPDQVRRACQWDDAFLSQAALTALGPCVREGYDSVEKLALRQIRRGILSRVAVHRQWQDVAFWVEAPNGLELWTAVIARVRAGVDIHDAWA